LPYIEGVSTMADRFFRGYFELDFVDTTTFSFSSDDGIEVFVNSEYLGSWGRGCHAPGCVNLQPCGIMDEVPPVDITAYLQPGGNLIGVHLTNCECCCSMQFGGEVTFVGGDGEPTEKSFLRSDSDQDGRASLTDAVKTLNCLFSGQPCSPCLDAEDSNDDGGLDLTDAVFTLNYLFIGGAEPPPPVVDCGPDPSEDSLMCDDYPPCQ
jgi:hypothetical protein